MFQSLDSVLDAGATDPRLASYPWPAPVAKTTVLGVDVGQIRDYTAICACSYRDVQVSPGDPLCGEAPVYETHYDVLGAQRLELGTSYPAVAQRVATMARRLHDRDGRGDYHILCDATGVGRPVVELIRAAIDRAHLSTSVHVTAVTITGSVDKGDDSILWREESRVGKAWLVSRLQAILQGGRLHAPRDPLLEDMVEELKRYEIRIKADTGHEQAGAFVTGAHDDLATSLALAVASEHQPVRAGPRVDSLPSPRL